MSRRQIGNHARRCADSRQSFFMKMSWTNAKAALLVRAAFWISTLCSGTGAAYAPSSAPVAASTALAELTATQAVALLCSRNVTAEQYLNALFQRLDGGYTCLNAFQTLDRQKALAEAKAVDAKAASGGDIKPLCGLPLAVKDSIDVAGYPTSASTPALLDIVSTTSAPLIDTYRAAGGVIMAKTVLAELSSSGTSINPTTDRLTTPLNPYNHTRHAGGSSGGSGVAVAASLAPLALCEDTGGSCRLPASATGIFGFRPTLGCYNFSNGLVPATFTRDTVGSMARNMEDLILLDSVLRSSGFFSDANGLLAPPVSCAVSVQPGMSLNGTRLGLPSTFGWQVPGLSGEIQDVTNRALTLLKNVGAQLVPFDSSPLDVAAKTYGTPSLAFEEPQTFARYLWSHPETLNISVGEVFSQINRPDLRATDLGYLNMSFSSGEGNVSNWVSFLSEGRPTIHKVWKDIMGNNTLDAMLYPIWAVSPRPIDATEPYSAFQNGTVFNHSASLFTIEDAQIDQTALSFPIGMSTDGLPAGLQIGALPGDDGKLLSLALAIEKVVGSIQPPPAPRCSGCTANVTYSPASFNGEGQPAANDTWSIFSLRFNGDCPDSFLRSYGSSGPLGTGVVSGTALGQANMTNMGIVASN